MLDASQTDEFQIRRRQFLHSGALLLTAAANIRSVATEADPMVRLRIGLVTDLHYADKDTAGSRHYRETLTKIAEASTELKKLSPAFMVELGDLIDRADTVSTELSWLKKINQSFSAICDEQHYVLGNHCVDTLTKQEFLGAVGQKQAWYSFDRQDVHFVILDSCFRSDGTAYQRKNFEWTDANIPAEELEWLQSDLQQNNLPTIVFAHQRLDVADNHGVRNNADVRKILQESGNVRAVFQGHSHQNDLHEISGISYCTLAAMVEGTGPAANGYSSLEILSDGSMRLQGFRRQQSRSFS